MKPLLSVWVRPKATIRFLHEQHKWFSYLQVVLGLSSFYFLLSGVLSGVMQLFPSLSELFSSEGLKYQLQVFVVLIYGILLLIAISSVVFHFFARLFGGRAPLFQTITTLLWTGVTTLPLSICFIITIWSGHKLHVGKLAGEKIFIFDCMMVIFAICFCFFFVYSLILLMKMLSETHKISQWRATGVVLCGIAILGLIPYLLSRMPYIFSYLGSLF